MFNQEGGSRRSDPPVEAVLDSCLAESRRWPTATRVKLVFGANQLPFLPTGDDAVRFIRLLWSGLLFSMVLGASQSSWGAELPGLGPPGELRELVFEKTGEAILRGRNTRLQLLVTGRYASGQQHDLTHAVTFTSSAPQILQVQPGGFVLPQADGEAVITAQGPNGLKANLTVKAEQCAGESPVQFVDEVVPIFTRLGCNAGGCHGKSDGQNGFRLSLLGFYPEEDYEFLVHESRGRRIFPADPEFSLLLLKPANLLPHGGGQRITPGTYEWDLIARWIRQGMPYGAEDAPTLQRIEVFPAVREMNFSSQQQLAVVGYYSDGTSRDVTRLATYEANQPEMASVEANGRVKVYTKPGETAIMIRFQGQVAVFRSVLPQGTPLAAFPAEKNFIDKLVFERLRKLGISPSPVCDDATFIRRVTIDLTGQLPDWKEVETFLADNRADKRDRLVDQLIRSPGYADYFANKWAAVLRNKRRNGNDVPYTYRFHGWIRQSLLENMPYDQFVRSILTATGDVQAHPPVAWYREVATTSEQMEDTAQLFLGIRLGCAKCHHHPFERWSQQDYYGFEAFFTQVGLKVSNFNPQANMQDMVYLKGNEPASRNPRTGLMVKPAGLGDKTLEIPAWDDARHALVDWMAAPTNPFFAKSLVNRYWKHFLGRGIVDPEDDLRVTNPPSNPELLDALAQHFVAQRFDLQNLVRTICTSSVYQLDSQATELNAGDQQNFSSFYPRRLNAEVLYDAINRVAGVPANFNGMPAGTLAVQLPDNGFNNYFLQVFGKPEAESACECERSPEANLAQSLHLLNSSDVQNRLQSGNSLAAQLARDAERPDADKIKEVYLRTFARLPKENEQQLVLDHVTTSTNKQQAWEDVIWALLNAKEFQFVR